MRLKKRASFLKLSQNGKKAKFKHFTVLFVLHADLDLIEQLSVFPRVGFTASKRVGNAVCRNKAKRRLRALAAEFISSSSPYDYVFVAYASLVNASFEELRGDFQKLVGMGGS